MILRYDRIGIELPESGADEGETDGAGSAGDDIRAPVQRRLTFDQPTAHRGQMSSVFSSAVPERSS